MATKVFMEALSPTMEEGRLVKWHKRDGDAVKTGETLAEVETDKAVMELVAAPTACCGRSRSQRGRRCRWGASWPSSRHRGRRSARQRRPRRPRLRGGGKGDGRCLSPHDRPPRRQPPSPFPRTRRA